MEDEEANKEEKPAVKKMKMTNLDFTESCPMPSTKAAIDAAFETEVLTWPMFTASSSKLQT